MHVKSILHLWINADLSEHLSSRDNHHVPRYICLFVQTPVESIAEISYRQRLSSRQHSRPIKRVSAGGHILDHETFFPFSESYVDVLKLHYFKQRFMHCFRTILLECQI